MIVSSLCSYQVTFLIIILLMFAQLQLIEFTIKFFLDVFRPSWATIGDTKEMCDFIHSFASQHENIIMTGDFNFADMMWINLDLNGDTTCQDLFRNIITEHQLIQIIRSQRAVQPL